MKFTTIESVLKNGETIVIREAQISDAPELITVVKEYIEESEFIPYIKGEFNPTLEEEEKWIQSFIDNKNSLLLVATHQGRIIGNIDFSGLQQKIMYHTARLGMGMLSSWQGYGIGSLLLENAIKWAKNNSPLEIIYLEAYANNEAGLALYKKYGFVESGKRPEIFKVDDKTYIDEIIMTLRIK
ncbi:GNAT family N-acetyltransferase [Dysgonomonas sp. GY617]|uniref:GNAT family N-acetyltransferase n=1 Tax=Dysgonomonas sp. GY617 TaxID=2780420 RepID=UPI0018838BF0|nr:GNAT family protein [Dysgonomonas sp. GY617]MBF0576175.1 GNAT family N-acetyltransferase [Dysgonomonas sp. GY617]